MNVKKFLKKKAQEDLQAIRTDKDEETLQQLQARVPEDPHKKRRNLKWLWAIPSVAVACAVTAVLIVELRPSPDNDLGDVKYDEVNFKQAPSDIAGLTNALTDMTLHFKEDQDVGIVRYFDSLSGDDIYYILTVDESSMELAYSMRLMIVVNDKYDYSDFNIGENFETKEYPDYSVVYKQSMDTDPDMGLTIIEGKAKINHAKYEMYVLLYQEYTFDNGNFLMVINNLLGSGN